MRARGDDEECARAWFSKYTVEEKNQTVHSDGEVSSRKGGRDRNCRCANESAWARCTVQVQTSFTSASVQHNSDGLRGSMKIAAYI